MVVITVIMDVHWEIRLLVVVIDIVVVVMVAWVISTVVIKQTMYMETIKIRMSWVVEEEVLVVVMAEAVEAVWQG